ncbi:solute carrier organic anion transporter family member 4A1-like [Diadema antillarum]|uniref:solute carrier organic anion transporter family member 4A1-like n=1 Tax=Diadema antillarum TaxID=105358 RepID=UPI003A884F25
MEEGNVVYRPGTRTSTIGLYNSDALQNLHDLEINVEIKNGIGHASQTNDDVTTVDNEHCRSEIGRRVLSCDPDESGMTCGWLGFQLKWLQKMCTAPWLLFCMCCGTFSQGIFINGFIPSAITSLERRFQLSSEQSGLLISTYDIVSIVVVLFVVYVGGRGHKTRWVAVGVILLSVSAFLFSVPHFTTQAYTYAGINDDSHLCLVNGSNGCSKSSNEGSTTASNISTYYYLFIVATVIGALGALPMYTLGIAAIDESVSNEDHGLYLGIFLAVAAVGPGCGYLLSGIFLNIFTEITPPEDLNLSPTDPGWVGAWWIGFLFSGAFLLLASVPLSLFPRELPTTAKVRSEKENQAHRNAGSEATAEPGFGEKPSDLLRAIKFLVINPTFMLTALGGVADSLLINAFGAFLPKFLQNQFGVTASLATILTGLVVVVGGIIGTVNGGLIMRRYKLKVPSLLKLIIASNLITCMAFLTTLWHCPQTKVAGVTVQYDGSTAFSNINVTHTCNAHCSCAEDRYIPVCADGGQLEYLSPCHAGCLLDAVNETYSDCSCLRGTALAASTSASLGRCPTTCGYYPYLFSALSILLVIVNFTATIPEINVLLRVVPEGQRSMSLGLNSLLKRLLGAVPGPIVFGAVIDGSCLLWQDSCGVRGSCWIYDSQGLAWRVTVIAVVMKLFGACLNFTSLMLYQPEVDINRQDDVKRNSEKEVGH